MRTSFRTKVFIAAIGAAGVSLIVAALLLSWQVRDRQRIAIANRLIDEARLVAHLISSATALDEASLDAEADRLGQYSASRVTLIADDGRVVGDSTQTPKQLTTLDNHASRPEVVEARARGIGVFQRYSDTIATDMLYVAARARHPNVGFVRLALPLTEVDAQLAAIRNLTLVALAATIPIALGIAWALSAPLGRRVREIAAVANRYTAGEPSRASIDYGNDELGTVARVLDSSIQELGRRVDELSRDRARSDAILTGMVEGVLVVSGDGRLQLANRAAQQMLHVDGIAVGRHYLEVIRHPDISAQLTTALGGEDVEAREISLTRDPGRMFLARAAPVAAGGGGGAVLVLHDVTDLRRTDQIRRDFVANVSHELRTPLTAIRGYLEALRDDPSDTENTERFIDIIWRQTTRMERLVSDLLRLARLDARQEVLERVPCDVRQLFQAVVADLAPSVEAKGQRIVVDVPGECRVPADPAKLHDVIRNLVENAVNYSPDVTEIRLRAHRTDGSCAIEVIDSGPGLPAGDLTRVFERFYRVDKSRSRPGTGLGLAIVKHLVELHGGTVLAANRPEGGAVFTVTLPATA
ncbi:MAG TPA: ATP-binding protein [Vicinamibacterales bacterium]|nr:ATP-binding protein [Vicinamibacterales bacterium]